MDYCLIYVTATSHEEAMKVSQAVIAARLAACANILGPITSVYWWQGKLEEGREVAFLLKTRAALVDQVVAKVRVEHSYACPCVVAIPVAAGNPAFLEWIGMETRP
ncbi:MAG: periplasmic divalent cation tolerance protein [Rhodospirillaceae bacterium]|nr:MAG: periplasmic divalent cation tolerance protein [Rhodospirillaceae bacterium]